MNPEKGGVSVSPDGERFELPDSDAYSDEYDRLKRMVAAQRALGREIVVVMGVGFVGAVMAAVVADSAGQDGEPTKFVVGLQRPSVRSYWKIPLLNRGIAPLKSEDPEVDRMIRRCVLEKQTLIATYNHDVLSWADVIVVDVQCDYQKDALGDVRQGRVEMRALEESLRIIGQLMQPEALVLIETTVPPGTTEFVAYPIVRQAFEQRGLDKTPLVAHSYERVMPGRNYVASIRDYWRVCSGLDEESTRRVVKFLSEVLNVADYPLTVLDRPIESETAKIVENSYRATILAFLDEWSLFAERNGVDIVKVIDAIRVRPTHSNIMMPGPGIGGYCLPKDGALGMWAYRHILGHADDIFKITSLAIDINDTRALHAAWMTRDALMAMKKPISGARIAVLGAAYRQDVGDTRYSGSELIVRQLAEMRAEVRVHDPYVQRWWEFENQDAYPPGNSRKRFFENQAKLASLEVVQDLSEVLRGVDAIVLAVRHEPYLNLEPEAVVEAAGGPVAVVDCFGILSDEQIRRFVARGCKVVGMGRGHIERLDGRCGTLEPTVEAELAE